MRCDGMTWAQIGAALHYDASTVYKDLHRVMESPPSVSIYPRIADYM